MRTYTTQQIKNMLPPELGCAIKFMTSMSRARVKIGNYDAELIDKEIAERKENLRRQAKWIKTASYV